MQETRYLTRNHVNKDTLSMIKTKFNTVKLAYTEQPWDLRIGSLYQNVCSIHVLLHTKHLFGDLKLVLCIQVFLVSDIYTIFSTRDGVFQG